MSVCPLTLCRSWIMKQDTDPERDSRSTKEWNSSKKVCFLQLPSHRPIHNTQRMGRSRGSFARKSVLKFYEPLSWSSRVWLSGPASQCQRCKTCWCGSGSQSHALLRHTASCPPCQEKKNHIHGHIVCTICQIIFYSKLDWTVSNTPMGTWALPLHSYLFTMPHNHYLNAPWGAVTPCWKRKKRSKWWSPWRSLLRTPLHPASCENVKM